MRKLPARDKSGRILAIKWGYNPNSSSLGVDVTFLLFGISLLTLVTPLVSLLLRWRRMPKPSLGPENSAE